MKSSNKKTSYDSRPGSSVSLGLSSYFYITCFMFLYLRLLTSLTGVVYANSADDNGRKLPQSSVITSISPNNVNGRELLRAEMSVVNGQDDTKTKDLLKKMIEQIRSVEFQPPKQAPEPVIVPDKAPTIEPIEPNEPNKPLTDVPAQKQSVKQEAKSGLPNEPIAEETLQMLRNLAQEPEKIANPFELGEILFVNGYVKEAAIFYSEALKRKDPNDVSVSEDMAWILFQTGNCLRNDDMPAAAKMYQRLLTEYPNSPWAVLATARNNLITWYMKDELFKLIQQTKNAGSKQGNIR